MAMCLQTFLKIYYPLLNDNLWTSRCMTLVLFQEAKLRQLFMTDDIVKYNFSNFDPFPCPLDPTLIVRGIQPDNATLFKVRHLASGMDCFHDSKAIF